MQAEIERRQVEVGGHTVSYEVAGSGEAVVMVHGLSGSTRWWSRTIGLLAPYYRLYLVDLPGFGSMRGHPEGFVLETAASWLRAWVDAAGLRCAHFLGHSMGGYVCMHLAAQYPEVVGCMALIDPAGVPTGRSIPGHFWPLAKEALFSSPIMVPMLVADALRAGPRTLWRAANDLLSTDIRSDLHRVQAPTLIVWGEKDALVPPSLGYILRREIPHSRLCVISGARHTPMIDSPHELSRVLLQFLAGHPTRE